MKPETKQIPKFLINSLDKFDRGVTAAFTIIAQEVVKIML